MRVDIDLRIVGCYYQFARIGWMTTDGIGIESRGDVRIAENEGLERWSWKLCLAYLENRDLSYSAPKKRDLEA